MVNFLKEFEDAFENFLDLTIYFNENEIRYKFQGIWVSSNFEKDIQEKAKRLEYLLSRQLKNGSNNKVLLSEIQSKLRETYNVLYDVYYDDFDNLSKSNLKLRYSSTFPENSLDDIYTYEYFDEKGLNRNSNDSENEFPLLYESLSKLFENNKKEKNANPSKIQFENVKLLECIYCYREILYQMLSTIDYYIFNFDKIDFSKIEANEFRPIIETVKCNLNLSKIEAAKFFSFLIYEKIIFIDSSNEQKDKIRIQKFIENNFTYKSLSSKQEAITKINREISEFKLHDKKVYNKVIDDFIKILESKKKT